MKKLLLMSTILLSLSLAACGNTTPKDTSKDDDPISEKDESQEDVYLDYPDDKEYYYVPKYATFESWRETTQGTNPDGSIYLEHEFNVIINDNEIYAVMYPGDATNEQVFYMKGRYIPVSGMEHMFTWVYDVYIYSIQNGGQWSSLVTGEVSIALGYFYGAPYFNFHYMKDEYSASKTGKTLTIEGEQLEEYYHSFAALYVYYSQNDDVIKAYKTVASADGSEKYYTKHYMVNYQTDQVEIPSRPGEDVLKA